MAVGTTRGKRRLGRYIRPLMERAGLEPADVAKQALCARQTVTRLLTGHALPRIHLFMIILNVIQVTEDERQRALSLWEAADADMTTIEHAHDLPVAYMRLRMDEQEALRERTLDTVLIPGLLQTPAYAFAKAVGGRALIRGRWDPETEAAERRDRQCLLRREGSPLELHALIDEAALCRMIGGPAVMVEQLDHLLAMAELPHVTIQVIPFEAGADGALSGPLLILGFPEDDEPDSAFVESLAGLHTVEKPDHVSALSAVWDGVAGAALPSDESVTFIRSARDKVRGT